MKPIITEWGPDGPSGTRDGRSSGNGAYVPNGTLRSTYYGMSYAIPQSEIETRFEFLDSSYGKWYQYNSCSHYKCERESLGNVHAEMKRWLYYPQHPEWGSWVCPCSFPPAWLWEIATNGYENIAGGGSANASTMFGTYGDGLKNLPPLRSSWYGNGWSIPDPTNLSDRIARSVQAMLPEIRPDTNSIVNDLLEYRDVGSILSTGRSLWRLLKRLSSSRAPFGKVLTSLIKGKGIPHHLLHASADVYLQQQFNVMPLYRDILAVHQAISDVGAKLKQLRDHQQMWRRSHYVENMATPFEDTDMTLTADLDPGVWQNAASLSPFSARRLVYYPLRRFYGNMTYWYTVPTMGGLIDQTNAFLDDIGINLNPAIVWNAIPWSFVIDWVLNVNLWLDQFKYRQLEPVTVIGQYCWTMHVKRVTTLMMGYGGSANPVQRISEEAYRRQVAVPNWISSIQTSGLSLKEFSLASALAITRRRPR